MQLMEVKVLRSKPKSFVDVRSQATIKQKLSIGKPKILEEEATCHRAFVKLIAEHGYN